MSLLAREGFSGYCRQTFIGGNYGLIDKDTLEPNNDFFSYYLWKNLMGRKVLDIQTYLGSGNGDTIEIQDEGEGRSGGENTKLKVYAHCTQLLDEDDDTDTDNANYLLTEKYTTRGSLTLVFTNFEKELPTNIHFPFFLEFPNEKSSETMEKDFSITERHEYILTPSTGQLDSPFTTLNEETDLKVKQTKSIPPKFIYPTMSPKVVTNPSDLVVSVPPLSYGFIVYPNAGVEACM